MSAPQNIDPALLRAFSYIAEEASFTRAAERIGRTQSAVSLQVQRLEAILGQTLLLRGKGGAVHLTAHGQFLLDQSRELLELNDRIWTAFREPALHGTVRLGCPDDYVLRFLPTVLRRFATSHPSVNVDVLCLPSRDLVEHLRSGDLDLMICSKGAVPSGWPSMPLWQGQLLWITSSQYNPHRLDPLVLALSVDTPTCDWRDMAITALEKAGRAYRIAYNSESLAGTYAPVLAGLAVTVSNIADVPPGLRVLPNDGDVAAAGGVGGQPRKGPPPVSTGHRRPRRPHRRDVPDRDPAEHRSGVSWVATPPCDGGR